MKLGINIDHVATLRQQRQEDEPDLLMAAQQVMAAGADGITIHLREDRRHIQDDDVVAIRNNIDRLNLEMSISPEIVSIACQVKPDFACLVPEKRQELTTEGGLDVLRYRENISNAIKKLNAQNIVVSLFIDPDKAQIQVAKDIGAQYIELHTGKYAISENDDQQNELNTIQEAATLATSLGLKVNAGHGLKYYNVQPIAKIPEIIELNIGHSIVSRAMFVGLSEAVKEMKAILLALEN